ncbi:hypothetical protein Dsui_3361 [Azospira oryzae PS]|uniref:Uncharacterized protein n=1 Tax=Azospira oryzae (strain ATCC BAA-33 / DSM 13638 / PS) TaxID=640081 RepID=G8QK12_AZOOP|nr:hypothetical protein [Azospira oryzae]AEV27691.1 hypothetical protein Dsui_3361 [Azospira oryzae PS]
MEALHNPSAYPADVALRIETMGDTARSIANRWLLGWPDSVKGLLKTGAYLSALEAQVDQEKTMLAEQANLRHLAPREIREMFELREEPPMPVND